MQLLCQRSNDWMKLYNALYLIDIEVDKLQKAWNKFHVWSKYFFLISF